MLKSRSGAAVAVDLAMAKTNIYLWYALLIVDEFQFSCRGIFL